MSKIIATVIVATLTFLTNTGSRTLAPSAPPPPDEMEVMVLFSGLMVFNFNPNTQSYEVGILGADLSAGHEFCVQQLGAPRVCRQTKREKQQKSRHKPSPKERTWLPEGPNWTILVKGTQPSSMPAATKPHGRRPDVEESQFDFDWIIDLEATEFHGEKLDLIPGKLRPIIQLPKVKLFTKYKSPDFFRWQGPTKPSKPQPFGFVAETIGFRVQLKKDEEFILQEVGDDDPIVRIPYVKPTDLGGNYEVVIVSNTRYPQHRGSDFYLYYQLFSKLKDDPSKWFDFAENETEPCDPVQQPKPCQAFNPSPKKKTKDKEGKVEYKTCCNLVCTEVLLGSRNKALE